MNVNFKVKKSTLLYVRFRTHGWNKHLIQYSTPGTMYNKTTLGQSSPA